MTDISLAAIAELQKNSMVNIMGTDFNVYAISICMLIILFMYLFFRAQKKNHLNWVDMLTRGGTKVSTTKVLQLIGGVVATWVIIKITLNGTLSWDMFAIYLAYVASIDGYSKLIMAKYGSSQSDDSAVPFKKPIE